ncbi:MAG TPA: ATP-binding protein [Candidatus Sulfotelmatobacter sp.]|nr:ATP-binding protein [Candidatus Sulfotelmatobacter sp.]
MQAQITLQNRLSETGRLVHFVENFAAAHGIAADEVARLQVILEELLTNVVKYGYAEPAGQGSISVALALERGRLSIEFDDDGVAFDPLTHQPPDLERAVEERPVGGLGLHILRALADEAHYRRQGGRNHLSLVRRIGR